MSSSPKITVLMPVYNCELYVKEAVDSILNQTFSDFEFIIIDDASTDSTVSIIKSYNDPRIQLIEKPQNSGYTNSLNNGLSIAKGEYIARMDGDDISLPERFAKQVAFLDANPGIILCGTLYQIIGKNKISDHPLSHEEIKVKLISGCYIAHPTVMIRKTVLEQNKVEYDVKKEPAEDYDLWSRLAFLGELANIGEVLLYYREHLLQTSNLRREKQEKVAQGIKIMMLQKVVPDLENASFFPFDFSLPIKQKGWAKEFKTKMKLLNLLVQENNKNKIYDSKLFSKFIKEEKISFSKKVNQKLDHYSVKNGISVLFNIPEFFKYIGFRKSGKFIIKCFLQK
ncbi:glycosyltransferase [[Flexibacter] sp. ATCC 35103]|uniref:glycosyltransferase family 2 protein n=1 Tax=[Flexibacter] sp. ATCC 35103 TaxID=1937528 RepID=UPI0009CF3A2E|nr:glycosyltransferase [[Flexibacter] sp. ATCC 35103]OMQ09871.1 hypothetical protein BXU01_15940 [[Flexibacter] sp. ATCC 35103]